MEHSETQVPLNPPWPKRLSRAASRLMSGLGILLTVVLVWGIASHAFTMPFGELSGPILGRYASLSKWGFYAHTFGGGIALIVVLAQFWLAKRSTTLHRIVGRVYVMAILVSSAGGYYMAWNAYGGWISTIGLSLLATLWWTFTVAGVFYAKKGDLKRHRRWMIRSAALTLAAITLRVMSPFLYAAFDVMTAQQIVYWLCWTFNLLIAQWWLHRHP